jgi:protein SCO1/2
MHHVIFPFRHRWHAVSLAAALALFAGCGDGGAKPDLGKHDHSHEGHVHGADTNVISFASPSPDTKVGPGMQANPLESTNVLRAFMARGVIREIPVAGTTLVVKHEEIPGFMPKMTMEFDVHDTNELGGLTVGDVIVFRVRADEKESWIENIRRAGTNDVISTAPADPSSVALLHVAKMNVGDELPDARLLDEHGATIKMSSFRGQALAFTFIFTRCPLPDFCPRMNQNFSRAREILTRNSAGPTNWQFLSVSFDPEFDKPGVLSRYAYSYRGEKADRWLFAAASGDVMSQMSAQLDFRFANEGDSFLHNLRTVVLDAKGRVYRQFDGNKWKAEDLARAMTEAATTN